MNVKIYGAGSIGNHLAQASRRMGWDVCVVDKDPEALRRMRESIYPSRYGAWDERIALYELGSEPAGGFDIIMGGTPPDVRLRLAMESLRERPRAVLLEKPLCAPGDADFKEFVRLYRSSGIIGVIGYDHAVSPSVTFVRDKLRSGAIGNVVTLDVEFREHWAGIFNAHPWLTGPHDTYLGFRSRGGGASGEHSHALHLWLALADAADLGNVSEVSVMTSQGSAPNTDYDEIAAFTLGMSSFRIGRVVQDVVTNPPRKWARVQGDRGFIEWHCNVPNAGDVVVTHVDGKEDTTTFPKKRPDDFYAEMLHLNDLMEGKEDPNLSPISLESGIRVMGILNEAYVGDGTFDI